jgi:hypothetical protein
MAESRYEQYIMRKPGIRGMGGRIETVEVITPKLPGFDTGPLVWWSPEQIEGTEVVLESGIISGGGIVGNGKPNSFEPHKTTNYDGEFFMFLGTDPDDPMDLGAEAEFYLGEGETLEKVTINRSACVYVPPGVGHFPLIWKNVKRPVMFVVVVPSTTERDVTTPVSLEGRPTSL